MMKKAGVVVLVAVVVLAAGGFFAWRAFTRGTGGFDDWVVRKIVDIAEVHIVPDVEFSSFDYDMPYTVTFEGLELVAPDGTKVVEAGRAVVTLAEAPARDKPIKIESIELRDAMLRLIRHEGGFRGLVPFVEGAAKDPDAVAEDVRLSNVLQLRKVTLVNGGLVFDAGDGSPAMELSGITTDMDIEPVTEDGRTWHTLKLEAGREPLMSLAMHGRIDLDAAVLDVSSLTLGTNLDSETARALPPALQNLVRDHDANGRLDATASGIIDSKNAANSSLQAEVRISDFNVAQGEYKLPIKAGTIALAMSSGVLTGKTVSFDLLEGTLSAPELRVDTTAPGMPLRLAWDASQLELRELLRGGVPAGQEPKLAGKLDTSGRVSMVLGEGKSSISGAGDLRVRDGRLVAIPLVQVLERVMKLAPGAGTNSRADVEFDLDGRGVAVRSLALSTPVLAAEGDGRIGYDTSLDLLLRAGPVEKVESLLGDVGEILGQVSDRLVQYRVTGTAKEPKVEIKPLGL